MWFFLATRIRTIFSLSFHLCFSLFVSLSIPVSLIVFLLIQHNGKGKENCPSRVVYLLNHQQKQIEKNRLVIDTRANSKSIDVCMHGCVYVCVFTSVCEAEIICRMRQNNFNWPWWYLITWQLKVNFAALSQLPTAPSTGFPLPLLLSLCFCPLPHP